MGKLPQVFVSDVERIGDLPPGGKLPKVQIGKASREIQATTGTATGEAVPSLLSPVPRDQGQTLSQIIEANDNATAPVLLFHELTGPEHRQVVLGGRALPFRGSLKFAGDMRLESTPYVGYPRVNQSVLGAQEQGTEMNGEWHDRFLLDPSTTSAVLRASAESSTPGEVAFARTEIRTARDLCVLFDDIRVSGRLLRVTWMHIKRLGRIATFEQDWQNPHDVKWRMKFDWIGRDDQVGLPSPTRTSLVGIAKALNTGYVDLHTATNFDGVGALDPGFADRIDTVVGRVRNTIDNLGDAIEARLSSVSNTADALRRVLSLAADARDGAQDVIDSLNDTVAASMLAGSVARQDVDSTSGVFRGRESLSDFLGIDPGDQIAAACQQMGAIRAARALRHIAARQRQQAIRDLDNEVIAIVHLREQEDLRDIATQWYGTPDDWNAIRTFNGLSSSTAPPGTLILVPASRSP